jgi:excisionase family DNA binding protein
MPITTAALNTNWREQGTLTVDQAATVLSISRWSAYDMARRGEIPVVRLGRRVLVPTARLRAMLGEVEPLNNEGAAAETNRDDAVKLTGGDGHHAGYGG